MANTGGITATNALSAYKRVLDNNRNIVPQNIQNNSPLKVLRAGDDLEVQSARKSDIPTFESVLDKMVVEPVNQIKSDTRQIFKFANSDNTSKNPNTIELLAAANDAEIAIKLIGEVRNKIITAYQEILRMPI